MLTAQRPRRTPTQYWMVRVKSIFFVKFQVWSVPITGRLGSLLATVVKLDIRGTVFRFVWMLYIGIEHRLDRRRKHFCTELLAHPLTHIQLALFVYLPCMGRNELFIVMVGFSSVKSRQKCANDVLQIQPFPGLCQMILPGGRWTNS